MAAYSTWASKYPKLAMRLPTAATPRPGRHVYCRADVQQVRSASKSGSATIDYGNGELRGGDCYCLLPPSHNSDGAYRWLIPMGNDIPAVDLHDAGLLPQSNTESAGEPRELKDMSNAVLDCPPSACKGVGGPPSAEGSGNSAFELAIARTLPVKNAQRHRCLFEFARELKALPEYRNAKPSELRPILVRWHQCALPMIRTKELDESWMDFLEGWGRVKFPKGQEPIQIMFETAKQAAENCLPEVALRYDTSEVRLLICLCRELQRHHGDAAFFLDCRTAGRLIGIKHDRAFRWLGMLCTDKVLDKVSSGSQKGRRANEYRYLAV
jgi:hypothetical protein